MFAPNLECPSKTKCRAASNSVIIRWSTYYGKRKAFSSTKWITFDMDIGHGVERNSNMSWNVTHQSLTINFWTFFMLFCHCLFGYAHGIDRFFFSIFLCLMSFSIVFHPEYYTEKGCECVRVFVFFDNQIWISFSLTLPNAPEGYSGGKAKSLKRVTLYHRSLYAKKKKKEMTVCVLWCTLNCTQFE